MFVERFVISPLQSNCYVLAEADKPGAKAVIVDCGDVAVDPVLRFIDAHQLQAEAIWCTHAHFDHVLGVDAVRRRFDIPAWVHRADLPVWQEVHQRAKQWVGVDVPALGDPDAYWEDGDTAVCGELAFQIVCTPGHSPGSVCLVGDVSVFSGDTLFAGTIGRVDLPLSDPAAMEISLQKVAAFPDELVVYPGHGPQTFMGQEKARNPFLLNRQG